jgi:acyl carrier protein
MNENEVLEKVRAELVRIKVEGAEEATLDTTWEELDVDSLDLVELVQALEDEYAIRIDDEQLRPIKSVGDAVRLAIAVKEGAETPA